MTSWKTTLCGVLAIIGGGLTQFFGDIPVLLKIGGLLATTMPAIGLLFARDNRVTSEQVLGDSIPVIRKPSPGDTDTGKMPLPALIAFLGLTVSAGLFGSGCRALEPGGAYQGDQVLYHAELTTVTSYDVIHTFVKWEHENRAALAIWPEIKQAADTMRRGAAQWFKTAYALRDAYALEPTAQNRAALEKALAVLRTALTEAAGYMARATNGP